MRGENKMGVVKMFVEAVQKYWPDIKEHTEEIVQVFSKEGEKAAKDLLKKKMEK